MEYQNHLVDPTYFWDAIEEFTFSYEIYTVKNENEVDEYGNTTLQYNQSIIQGSLQSDGKYLQQEKSGNKEKLSYRFYCKSIYRIDIGDIIKYKNNYLRVNFVQDLDEYGVREAKLNMIQLSAYRDFADYIKYINGEKLI